MSATTRSPALVALLAVSGFSWPASFAAGRPAPEALGLTSVGRYSDGFQVSGSGGTAEAEQVMEATVC
jgi:hypothetical protein